MMLIPSRVLRRISADRSMKISLALLMPIILAAILADVIAPYNPLKTGVGPALSPPSAEYLMGTDQAGGDIFSQVIHGSRVALYVAVLSTLLALAIAILIGLPAGYYRGVIDEVLMRITDIVLSIPSFVLIIFLVVLFGSDINIITMVIGFVSWPTLARIIRAQVLSLREREFVLAARALGASSKTIMVNEILPNTWLSLLPAITLQMGFAVLIETGLSFLGLGDQNVSSWGRALWLASRSIYAGSWWSVLFPGLAIIITILAFNMLGDAISRIINPREIRR